MLIGLLERSKVRLVVKGFNQTPRFNFSETLCLVVKFAIIRVIIIVSLAYDWDLRQVDVNNVILFWFIGGGSIYGKT